LTFSNLSVRPPEDAAYVFKGGLHGVWGISNRVNYEAPRDEIDRKWLVTPRKR